MVQERTIRGSHQELMFLAVTDIVNQLIQAHIEKKDVNLNSIKGKSASKYGLASQPRLVDIIAAVPQQYKRALVPKLKSKPVCTASGIAVVAVMCKPHSCPHIAMTGNIYVYCPGGPDSDFEYSTQSYTGYEPSSIRAKYNPYLQTRLSLSPNIEHNILTVSEKETSSGFFGKIKFVNFVFSSVPNF